MKPSNDAHITTPDNNPNLFFSESEQRLEAAKYH